MTSQHSHQTIDCIACELPTQERLNYFTGQFLTERDLRDEQIYLLGKQRQHNRYLHGMGVVCGLRVEQHPNPDCRDRFVVLQPGLALDCCGREILVREPVFVDLDKALVPKNGGTPPAGKHLLFSLCYSECKTEFVPMLYSECGCDSTGCEANRIYEGFTVDVQLTDQLPASPLTEPGNASLEWSTTINLAQASRLALDATRKRLYVMTAANPGQIMVYDSSNQLLLRTISLGASGMRGVDLAIAPNGQFLYVILQGASATNAYDLRVLDLQNSDTIVNTLLLTTDALTTPPQVVVSPAADGRIYTLIPDTSSKVIIWKTTINTGTVDPNLPLTDPNSPKFAEVTGVNDGRAIAVSPNGVWLLLAEGGGNQVRAFKVDTLNTTTPVSKTLSLAESPRLLAVSDNNAYLDVVTVPSAGNFKLRSFEIQDGAVPTFTEVNAPGIAVGAGEAIRLAAAGRSVYLLSADNTGKGEVRVINRAKFQADPSRAISAPVTVVSNPKDLLLDSVGQRLYAAGGTDTPVPTGGVSILEAKEAVCQELFWQSLEGCPPCPSECVPLAVVANYTPGSAIADPQINNRIRPLVPSTETLKKLILCTLEQGATSGAGAKGEKGEKGEKGDVGVTSATVESTTEGSPASANVRYVPASNQLLFNFQIPPGRAGDVGVTSARVVSTTEASPASASVNYIAASKELQFSFQIPPGRDGRNDEGLEADLTQIDALSWIHNTGNNKFASIVLRSGDVAEDRAIVIRFTRPVRVSDINAEHIFQVLVRSDLQQREDLGFACRCPVVGRVVPVDGFKDDEQGRIRVATEIEGPDAPGAAFLFGREQLRRLGDYIQLGGVRIRLQGDFVVDEKGRAIDAEFVRAELPTGDRPSGNNFGVQGGVFESWFWLGDPPKPEDPQ